MVSNHRGDDTAIACERVYYSRMKHCMKPIFTPFAFINSGHSTYISSSKLCAVISACKSVIGAVFVLTNLHLRKRSHEDGMAIACDHVLIYI